MPRRKECIIFDDAWLLDYINPGTILGGLLLLAGFFGVLNGIEEYRQGQDTTGWHFVAGGIVMMVIGAVLFYFGWDV
jgi:hypothetical protein